MTYKIKPYKTGHAIFVLRKLFWLRITKEKEFNNALDCLKKLIENEDIFLLEKGS